MALYPGAVRTYSTKQDQITTIDAADVNDLQDEMGATQRTLGVNPTQYAAPGQGVITYPTVAARMNAHEAALTNLQNQINTLSYAASHGWSTPVLRLSQSGVTPPLLTPARPTAFADIVWSAPPLQDPGGMWSGGPVITCVLGGWYTLQAHFSGAVDVPSLNAAQAVYNGGGSVPVPIAVQRVVTRLLINGTVQVSAPVHLLWEPVITQATHEADVLYSGALHTGDLLKIQTGQFNGNVSGTVTFSATFQRALPGVT